MLRDLNSFITRRAKQAIADADRKERERSGGSVPWELIADRMAEFVHRDNHDVRKQLKRYLEMGHVWRVDWLQAFARAVGLDPAELAYIEESKKPPVSEVTRAQLLWSAVAERLDMTETRRVTRLANQLLDNKARWNLVLRIAEVVSHAEDARAADLEIGKLVRESDAFDGKRRDLRKKPGKGRKV